MSEVSEIGEADWSVWRAFQAMRRELDRAVEQRLHADAGISGPDFEILLSLFRAADNQLRARDLGELLGWEKSRVSHQVTRMVARGLLERRECPTDLRGTWVVLLPEGRRAVLRASRGNATELRRLFFDVLTPAEKATLNELSERIVDIANPASCARADEILNGEQEQQTAS
ncbi:MarR family winged helix-turn-helix transcriptional regulator [Naasia aerilata]|uniref:MarR family transcriptional regulator n=1 Tax=Naasia aerilata TaxID=1162966 RepID=A0ABM8GHK2_9MICO|nr:MarR family winged helix-turn-helix transcriptional regulator [Naasia aerilata]BDZ47642.1 MarR family transcriptional regulator [Naasia aerilata]